MFAERAVLRGGPGHSRAVVVREGQPYIEIAHVPRIHMGFDGDVAIDSITKHLYVRTQEKDKWGKRIYRHR